MEIKLKVKMVDYDIVLERGFKGVNQSEILEKCYNHNDDIKIFIDKKFSTIKAIDLNLIKHTIVEDNKIYFIINIYSEIMI